MKIIIRNPVRREVQLQGKRRVIQLLKDLNLSPESHIVIRNRELLTSDEFVSDDDHVEILSAISGG
ncbi:MAG: MoaD/ThiS family protein [SAR202 cluster bacterium]|nr:MoaD/ThiS family protein [SAR202 cluster bacterium]